MIFRRMTNALRKRDWSVVAIEILVVVIGIFLGLQANSWKEARQFREQESVYLSKIRDDLAQMRAELVDRAAWLETSAQRMTSALRAMEACDHSDGAKSDVSFALEHYQVSPPIDYLDATYGEMVASGAHARLRSQELKRQISQTFSKLRDYGANLRNFRISVPVVDSIVWSHVDFTVDPDTGRLAARFDMTEVCSSRPMRNALVEMIDIQGDALSSSRNAIEAVDRSLTLLEDYSAGRLD